METMDIILPEERDSERSTMDEINRIEGEINDCKALLLNTDWCVIKCQETGEKMTQLYPDESAARMEARDRINDLEVAVATMYEALPKEEQSKGYHDNIL